MKTLKLTNQELKVIYNRLNLPNRIFSECWTKEENLTPKDFRVTDKLFEKVKVEVGE